jgi:hypothetical protein
MNRPARKPFTLPRTARDPRVTARGVRPRRFPRNLRGENTERFAQAIIARHSGGVGFGPLVELVLRRRAARVLSQTTAHSALNVHVSPLLTLNFASNRAVHFATTRSERFMKTEVQRVALPPRLERTIIERLVAREIRHEPPTLAAARSGELPRHGQTSSPAAPLERTAESAVPPEPSRRVFRRSVPIHLSDSSPRTAAQNGALLRGPIAPEPPLTRPSLARKPEPISPHELSRITDHVIDTIDRRITASRERRGMA